MKDAAIEAIPKAKLLAKYGKMWLSDIYERGEMNCANINKNR